MGRGGALLTATCAAAHLPLLFGHLANVFTSLIMTVLTAICLTCAPTLWKTPTPHLWTKTIALSTAMLTTHLATPTHHPTGSAALPLSLTQILWSTSALLLALATKPRQTTR